MEHDEVSEEYLLNIRREKTARELDRIRNSFSFRCGQIVLVVRVLFCVRLGTTWAATNPPSQQRSFDSGSEALCCVLSHQRRRLGAFHTPLCRR